jgi:hypothetical protein
MRRSDAKCPKNQATVLRQTSIRDRIVDGPFGRRLARGIRRLLCEHGDRRAMHSEERANQDE